MHIVGEAIGLGCRGGTYAGLRGPSLEAPLLCQAGPVSGASQIDRTAMIQRNRGADLRAGLLRLFVTLWQAKK